MLEIKNLQVSVEGKKILKGVDMQVKPGELHVLMGPNGSGKSTLAYALMGHPDYKLQITDYKLQMSLDGESLIGKTPDGRARMGLFLAFQYPVMVEGVSVQSFLKRVYESFRCSGCKEGLGLEKCPKMSVLEFRQMLKKEAKLLKMDQGLLRRSINDGFSGGERKKLEILQMSILAPKYVMLDEIDSGLDIDALRIVSYGIKRAMKKNKKIGVILITHYQRILRFIKPDFVQVMVRGKIVESGGKEVIRKIEKQGYKGYE